MYTARVVVLLSGGLDSNLTLAALLAQPIREVERVHALIFDYGQSSAVEIQKATTLCTWWRVPYTVRRIDPGLLQGQVDTHAEIPARNLVFLSLAASFAIDMGFNTVAIGAEPDSTYTDSTKSFLAEADVLLQQFGLQCIAPVKDLHNKAELVVKALELGVPLWLCHSSRSSAVSGGCKTSRLFLDAIDQVLHNTILPTPRILQELERIVVEPETTQNIMRIHYGGGRSFKYPAALFTVLAHPLFKTGEDVRVYSTGSWMHDLYHVANLPEMLFKQPKVRGHRTAYVQRLIDQPVNCDSKWGQWGLKQALAPLPRPRYLRAVACRVHQGHLAYALYSLGYEVELPAYRTSMLLETTPDEPMPDMKT